MRAAYSNVSGLTIATSRHLPNGWCGVYCKATKTILLDERLTYTAKRCTLTHELIHWMRGDDNCDEESERRTRELTALTLIGVEEYAQLEEQYSGNIWRIADELDVIPSIVRDFCTHCANHPEMRCDVWSR
ncbi:hypothetical protein BMAGN_1561 [Bifidobacterium magnum]|uniref:IrrE N-terminal-like domain-containing protein n=1 Tax=Bifidobacterium magnum TaxID=1692 RepID=A0A087B9Q1_9BIFI|nr:hypothetical protein BMAGN_1561 [Bifidobacterium magnum]